MAFIGAFSLAPVFATAVEDFLIIDRALVRVDNEDKEISALSITDSIIPKDGSRAFGYGILTDTGLDGVIVTTTMQESRIVNYRRTYLTPYFTTNM